MIRCFSVLILLGSAPAKKAEPDQNLHFAASDQAIKESMSRLIDAMLTFRFQHFLEIDTRLIHHD